MRFANTSQFISDNMNSVKLSIILTVISLVTLIIIIAGVGYLLVNTLHLNASIAIFLVVIAFHVVNFFVVQKFLKFKEKKYLISLKNGAVFAPFKGGEYFKFYMGLVWRMALLNIVVTPILENLAPNGDMLFSIASGSLLTFFSYLWLMKYSYGDVKIVFNVEDKAYVISDQTQDLEQVDFSQRKSNSLSSGFSDVLAGSLGIIFVGGYFLLGLIQYAAIYSFFRDVLEWWFIFSVIFSLFAAYTPVVGTGLGVYSAHAAWGWSWLASILLFTWPFILMLFFVIGSALWDSINSNKKR